MAAPVDPDRILIIRPSALGDVCRTVPVLASLRRAFPDARIEWVTGVGHFAQIEAPGRISDLIEQMARRC